MKRDFPWESVGVLLAAALTACFYWPALGAAYRQDDFAWLSLGNTLAAGHSLAWALFSPQAQGTIRPLGDRVWFLLASRLFGLNPVPMHALALAAQIANLALVADTGRRLLGSRKAAAAAVALWAINDVLAAPLVWASSVNQPLYTLWFLAAFNAFLRWESSRRPAWLWVHAIALVLSLATLELAVAMPLVVVAYMFAHGKREWKALVPSVAIAGAFVAAHFSLARLPGAGPYRLSAGWAVPRDLWMYLANVLGPEEYRRIYGASLVAARLGTAVLSAAILLWLWVCARRKRWNPVFCLLWFVLILAPVLPLQDHVTPYYAFLPAVGLAWLAGDALAGVASWPGRSLAIACAVLYACCQIPSTRFVRDWNIGRSRDMALRETRLEDAVRQIRRSQPRGPVFLTGLDGEQFWWGLCYGQMNRLGYADLHILPDAGAHGIPIPPKEWCLSEDFQLSPAETLLTLQEQNARVYDVSHSPHVARD